ncbi:hypothetical protein [Nocardia aurantiaca]|uniref:Uncharacterized protein n=1 Tax=Nocardia aurantiaca TaxID=2675850 RepID=A0A6I3KZG1_9NOCA|nr:hypothetical protein [Nocardia aurantiaca]MTE13815.1 hypothetical protein [Nocardia aurantiaca]
MLSTFTQNIGTLGSDILAIGSATLQFAQDLLSSGGYGQGGGAFPPGQYPFS